MNNSVQRLLPLIGLAGLVMLSACSDSDSPDTVPPADDMPMSVLDDTVLEQLQGVWEQRGYGNLYEYSGNRTTLYALTENTCIEVSTFEGLVGLSPEEVEQTRFDLQGDQLTLLVPGDAFATRVDRVETLPARCADTVARDAQGTFDYLWATFDEYYAFFNQRNVDWSAQYANLLPEVANASDDAALFELLADLLSPIDDGHVFLESDTDGFSPASVSRLELELEQGFQAQSEFDDFGMWIQTVGAQYRQAIDSRMDPGSINDQDALLWATANNGSTGYLLIDRMVDYAVDANGELLDNFSSAEDLAAANRLMDQAMADLADTTQLIIDVRLNGGGSDAIGLNFAQRFASERQLVLSKSARSRDFESIPVQAFLEPPATGAYLNPVTLLIGPQTASAAEIFTISMNQLPQVTLVGENTLGILSDILVKPLPNGWVTGLSNEVYFDAQGVSYEGTGVPPDIEVPALLLENVQAGEDPALDRALAL